MSAPFLDVKQPVISALAGSSSITALLGQWKNAPSIFSRSPVPEDAEYPMIVVNQITRTNPDLIDMYVPEVSVDVIAYGKQDMLANDDVRNVEKIAEYVHQLFHESRTAIEVTDYELVTIRCVGPFIAPADDENEVARGVSLTIQLSASRN